jgi:hypothetical protein
MILVGFDDRRANLCRVPSAYACKLVPANWIVVGTVVPLGIGILTGVKATRQKDPVG